ncbi:MAG: RDD family protein [Pyrinomonadaceae bacterium]
MAEPPGDESKGAENNPQSSKLIEFPGVSRNSVPPWRKELSERVREVHEKRAREAAIEAAERGLSVKDDGSGTAPQLELLPDANVAPLNPLVSAALRRIERAHHTAQIMNRLASPPGSAALAYAADNEYRAEALPEFEVAVPAVPGVEPKNVHNTRPNSEPSQPEKVHNLVVVPPQLTKTGKQKIKPKPRRVIVENDPALNYLDSVPTSVRVEALKYQRASALARVLGAAVDLMVVALLCAPFAALVELTNGNWRDLKAAATGAAVFSVMSFLYFTISTALTGRTLGMRLFSLRIVDARTGLIPTGKQSAGRALVYLATVLTLGLAALYVLIDRDKQTAHDRLTRTTVIAV